MFSWFKNLDRDVRAYPATPEGIVLYAIGDVHGRSDCLASVHALIDRDAAQFGHRDRAVEIYIGDYVDRGSDSRGVIDLLVARYKTRPMILLRGNHEIIMESFLRGLITFEDWRAIGGLETVMSYGVDARALLAGGQTLQPRDLAERLPISHIRFFSLLQNIYLCGRYCFVHAGIRPGIAIENQSIDDLTWIRDDFLNFSGDLGLIVVHGHTPVNVVDLLSNRVNIDTGAYATNRLSVVRIDASGLAILEDSSR